MSTFACVFPLANARLQLIVAAVDGAALPGEIWLYSGVQPPSRGSASTEPVQCVIPLPRPCATVAAGLLTLPANLEGERVGGLEITWGRFVDGAGQAWADFDVSTAAAGTGALTLGATTGAVGDMVRVTSGYLAE